MKIVWIRISVSITEFYWKRAIIICFCITYGCFCPTAAELSFQQRQPRSWSQIHLLSNDWQKSISPPAPNPYLLHFTFLWRMYNYYLSCDITSAKVGACSLLGNYCRHLERCLAHIRCSTNICSNSTFFKNPDFRGFTGNPTLLQEHEFYYCNGLSLKS